MSNVILKKCANNLKVLHEYIRVCEQFDPAQSSSSISIQQLNNLGVQKAFVLKVIDDVKAFMESNNDLLASSQLSSPQTSWQTTTDAIVQQYLKTHDHIDVDGMIMECSTAQLYDAWIERYNENREMYEDVR